VLSRHINNLHESLIFGVSTCVSKFAEIRRGASLGSAIFWASAFEPATALARGLTDAMPPLLAALERPAARQSERLAPTALRAMTTSR